MPMKEEPEKGGQSPKAPFPLSRIDLKLDSATAHLLNDAELGIRRFEASHGDVFSPRVFSDACMRIESIANVKMAGKQVSVRQLFRHPFIKSAHARSEEAKQEQLRNAEAVRLACELGSNARISGRTFVEIHRTLLDGTTRDSHKGTLRADSDPVGGSRYHSFGEPFTVPAPQLIPSLLDDLAAFCNRGDLPAVAQAALAHTQIIAIHPFERANGKTARAVIPLVLRHRGLIENETPPVSLSFSVSSHDYQKGVLSALGCLQKDAPQPEGFNAWLRYFSQCCAHSIKETEAFWSRVETLQAGWLARLNARSDSAAMLLVHSMAGIPVFTAASAADYIDRSFKRTTIAIDELVSAGIVQQITQGKRNRVFECGSIVDLYAGIPGFQ